MATKISEYKGTPILEIHDSADCTDKWPVRLGPRKVKAILENLDGLREFVAKHNDKEAKVVTPKFDF